MNKVKQISKPLFYLSRLVSLLYMATVVFTLVSIIFKTPNFVLTNSGESFQINFPLSNSAFLIGQNISSSILEMILGIMLYGLFFWLLSDVFKVFFQPKLFIEKSVKRLTLFYITNFIIPVLMFLFLVINNNYSPSVWSVAILHFLLGVFIFFMTAIFKQGLQLQNEQDLFI